MIQILVMYHNMEENLRRILNIAVVSKVHLSNLRFNLHIHMCRQGRSRKARKKNDSGNFPFCTKVQDFPFVTLTNSKTRRCWWQRVAARCPPGRGQGFTLFTPLTTLFQCAEESYVLFQKFTCGICAITLYLPCSSSALTL